MAAVSATTSTPSPASPASLFRGLLPYDETCAESFLGRVDETQAVLQRLLEKQTRTVVLTGEVGVGKTSLVRAGVLPALGRRAIQILYVDDPTELDAQVEQAAHRAGFGPTTPGESTPAYLARMVRDSRAGLVLVLDHLERAFAPEMSDTAATISALIAAVTEAAPGRVRLLLVISDVGLGRLGRLALPAGFEPSSPFVLERIEQVPLTALLERVTTHSGTAFEAGFAAALAGELCRHGGGCLFLELQLAARALIDRRWTSLRKLETAGDSAALCALFFESATAGPAARTARRILEDLAEHGRSTPARIAKRAHLAPGSVRKALATLLSSGVVVPITRATDGQGPVELVHRGLGPFIEAFLLQDRAQSERVRRELRQRLARGDRGRLSVRQLVEVRRTFGSAALSPAEQALFQRSVRRLGIQAAVGLGLVIALVTTFLVDARQTYMLAFDPPRGGAVARVVVRVGRPRWGLGRLVPWGRGRSGGLVADTGFSAAGLAPAAAARIAEGQATGSLDPTSAVPTWLRDVVNGLRPVPRGVAKALIGDPDGVTSLKQAFSDPLARREALDSLAVIGRGRAGEDEILAAALGDAAPEVRRRGVEVASEIDRRLGTGAHVTTLRNALGDRSLDVKQAVLRAVASLPAAEATDILTVALRDRDATFRKAVEDTTMAFAAAHPEAAAAAARNVLESPDGNARRSGMMLLERIATEAPAECAHVLEGVVADARAPEEARVAALLVLRRAGPPAPALEPLLEQASQQTASPRLRAAALPLYARLIDATVAEDLARAEMKGPPAARVTGAALWGAIAITRPDLAVRPLKGLIYDPSPDIRAEAARAFAFLKREGIPLCDKLLRDPSAEVEGAAVESLTALAPINPAEAGDILGRSIKLVRPGVRKQIIEALGQLGRTKPAAAIPALAHAVHDGDVATRVAVARAFCGLARDNANATSPYLRVAARDEARDVRTAAAACIEELTTGDPKGGTRMALELVASEEPGVRAAATASLGKLASRAPELAFSTLVKLIEDPDAAVRAAAVRGLVQFGEADAGGPGFAESKRGAEAERALEAVLPASDVGTRQAIVEAAARNRLPGVLRQALSDPDEGVRIQAVRAAGGLTPPELDVVRGAVDDRAPAVRAEATRLLAGTSGAGAREVIPIYEAALTGGDHVAREAAIAGLGELVGAGDAGARLLEDALAQRSESIRAAATRALGRLAERDPGAAIPVLERALHDPAYDVANAAIPGLAMAWSRQMSAEALGEIMLRSEADSARRFVALEALLWRVQSPAPGADGEAIRRGAVTALDRVADSGPPLARLAGQLGRAFENTPAAKMHPFLERLLGS
jgi:HEAT repeat protein